MSNGSCDNADAAGWVLGALSAEEAERFAIHLLTCAACRAEVAKLTEASAWLAGAAPLLTPPSELRERVMASVDSETSLVEPARVDAAPDPAGRRLAMPRRRHLVVSAVAALATGIAAVVLLVVLPASHKTQLRTVAGEVTPAGGARARAMMRIGPRTATLVVTQLAPASHGRVYQAWVIPRNSKAIPTGMLFSVPRSGTVKVSLPLRRDVAEVIITAEPPGGSLTPTPPPVVLVQLLGLPRRTAHRP